MDLIAFKWVYNMSRMLHAVQYDKLLGIVPCAVAIL